VIGENVQQQKEKDRKRDFDLIPRNATQALSDGICIGFTDGYKSGAEDGYGRGYDRGYSEGYRAGYAEAKAMREMYSEP
jgi:flagellar biosynthesis/type III secretory pathway protein FliH